MRLSDFTAVFIGGKCDGLRAAMTATPRAVVIGGERYDRLDDPETGEFLGGYTVAVVND